MRATVIFADVHGRRGKVARVVQKDSKTQVDLFTVEKIHTSERECRVKMGWKERKGKTMMGKLCGEGGRETGFLKQSLEIGSVCTRPGANFSRSFA